MRIHVQADFLMESAEDCHANGPKQHDLFVCAFGLMKMFHVILPEDVKYRGGSMQIHYFTLHMLQKPESQF